MISGLTGGAAAPLAGAEMTANIGRGAALLQKFKQIQSTLKASFNAANSATMIRGGIQMLKSFKNVNDAKQFYTGIRSGAVLFGQGTANFLNPLRQTSEVLKNINTGATAYRNMSNFAKLSKGFGAFYRDTRENLFALSESQLEGGTTKKDIIDDEIRIFKEKNGGRTPDGQDLVDIYNNADEAGRLDAAINIPLIYISNRFVFDGIFNFRGAKTLIEASEGNAVKGASKGFTWNLAEKTFKENTEGLLKSIEVL